MPTKSKQSLSNQILLIEIRNKLIDLEADIKEIKLLLKKDAVKQEAVLVDRPEIHPKEKTPAGWFY